ncbi:MAG: 50S ribosomal protein L18 [Candidatus Magasanikbacteria bacterium GW2011_GWA2_46_17]|uniref:Large ribosomal subunit protein uL18 n=1 Tax=Candidatus Magasanikbacteria bacterium GW2011_GWA2_46_17 TaxID=1619042 RepID=A0A0G1P3M9_9BACT|nr:MAG: 50S ribosomal protein L18 [Candidatus Magasanikbacteria bacterium GW2011_GWA2_46_17]
MKRLNKNKGALRQVRHVRVRARIQGTAERPRLSVFRGHRSTVAQLIDDEKGITFCHAHSREIKSKDAEGRKAKVAVGYLLGRLLAEKAKSKGVTQAVFDRGGYKYHGRVKSVAEGAREGGLEF